MVTNKRLKIGLPLLALLIAVTAFFAFSANKNETKKTVTYFFKYNGISTLQADIQNSSNYSRIDDPCSVGANVCGVSLATNQPNGQPPLATEFNAVKADLWTSQQTHTAANSNIKMRN